MNILVIGGTSGIGKACALALAEDNMVVAPSKDQLDVTSSDSIELFFRRKDTRHFQGLVYSAGVNYLAWHEEIDEDEAMHVLDVNILGFLRLVKYMATRRCVVIGSNAADMPMRTSAVYNASKAGLHAAVRCVAREAASYGGVFNIVAPGKIADTDMTRYVEKRTQELRNWTPEALRQYELTKMATQRYGTVDEVAKVVKWLMLEAPSYINGETINVDGGR